MTNPGEKPLAAQVALVTGGARGIGEAICRKLTLLGATVVAGDIMIDRPEHAEPSESVLYDGGEQGSAASLVYLNVADEQIVEGAVKAIIKKYGKIDILVNNAGISVDSLLIRTKEQDWKRTIDINLSGSFYCAKAVSKSMMKERSGRIINISSVIGQMGNAGQVAYSSSKAGLIGLTKTLARELAGRNITVNAVAPGYIITPMTEALSDEQKARILEQIPLNCLGEAEDVAEVVAFFASPGARYVTGQVLGISGGMYM